MLDIVEKYITLGGEAPLAGLPVYIIRFAGCNLHCSYCDTQYNDEINLRQSPEDLKSEIEQVTADYPGIRVMLTGGEPLLGERQDQIVRLMRKCPTVDFYIETNGSVDLADYSLFNCHYICDWKSPSAAVEESFHLNNLKGLRPEKDCIKFVVSEEDLPWLKETVLRIKEEQSRLPLYVSPQWGKMDFQKLAEFIVDNKMDLSLSLQIHKIIWPPDQRGV